MLLARVRNNRVSTHKDVTEVLLYHNDHDSERPYTSFHTQEVTKLQLIVLPHLSRSPELASSDSRPFGPLKGGILGKKIEDEKVISEVKC
jgi:hypothetical protein